MKVIDHEQLKVLESLLADGVIDQEEYNSKAMSLCGIHHTSDGQAVNNNNKTANNSLYILILVVIIALTAALAYMGTQNEQLLEENEQATRKYEHAQERANKYLSAIKNDYLDSAVLVIEGDATHYHRYNCPDFPANYKFWIYNSEAAVDRGYIECPTCFGIDSNSYIDNQL